MSRNQVVQNYLFAKRGHYSAWCETKGIDNQTKSALYAFLKSHEHDGDDMFVGSKWSPLLSYIAEKAQSGGFMEQEQIKELLPESGTNKPRVITRGMNMYQTNVNTVSIIERAQKVVKYFKAYCNAPAAMFSKYGINPDQTSKLLEAIRDVATGKSKRTIYVDLVNYMYLCIMDSKDINKDEWERMYNIGQASKATSKPDIDANPKIVSQHTVLTNTEQTTSCTVPVHETQQHYGDFIPVTEDIFTLVQKRGVPTYVKTSDLVAALSNR